MVDWNAIGTCDGCGEAIHYKMVHKDYCRFRPGKKEIDVDNDLNKQDSYIETFNGHRVTILDPKAEQICISDIAHSLSMQCRYTGHCKRFYSVAEHSVWVARMCAPEYALWGLLHDGTEAYLADIATPIKVHLSNYKVLEHGMALKVAERFGVDLTEEVERHVKWWDIQVLRREAELLMPSGGQGWVVNIDNPEPIPQISIQCWSPEEARDKFLAEFERLTR